MGKWRQPLPGYAICVDCDIMVKKHSPALRRWAYRHYRATAHTIVVTRTVNLVYESYERYAARQARARAQGQNNPAAANAAEAQRLVSKFRSTAKLVLETPS